MHYLITGCFSPFLLRNIRVYFEFVSLYYSRIVTVVVLVSIVLVSTVLLIVDHQWTTNMEQSASRLDTTLCSVKRRLKAHLFQQ